MRTCYPHLSMKHPHLQDALLPLVSFPSLFAFWTTHRKWPPPCPRACSYARCRLPSVPGTRQELNRGYFYFSELHHPVFNFCIHSTGRGSFFHPECVYHQGSHNIIRHWLCFGSSSENKLSCGSGHCLLPYCALGCHFPHIPFCSLAEVRCELVRVSGTLRLSSFLLD